MTLSRRETNAQSADSVKPGPSVGPLGRAPQGGRNWEGFGSDSYLQGVGAYNGVKGIQAAGVQACVKHFIANEQEHFRGDGHMPDTISPNIDDRTLHEVYLPPFSEAVRAGVASVMCSYNMINGSYGCENSKLMNGVLKDELGFQGYVLAGGWSRARDGGGGLANGSKIGLRSAVEWVRCWPVWIRHSPVMAFPGRMVFRFGEMSCPARS